MSRQTTLAFRAVVPSDEIEPEDEIEPAGDIEPAGENELVPNEEPTHWSHPYQQQLLRALENKDLPHMVDLIETFDRENGPNYDKSRINTSKVSWYWKPKAIGMMLRTNQRLLVAALQNELPRLAGLSTPRRQRVIVRKPTRREGKEPDPVIYINWLAHHDGTGLTREEFELLLRTVDEVVHPDATADIRDAIDRIWREKGTGGGRTSFMQSCNQIERRKATEFCRYHRANTLPRFDNDQTCNRIMIPGEVGWTMNFTSRAREHSTLSKASPWFFRLVSCVLERLWPGQFMMHQFVLFDVVKPEEAGIGESIGSHLLASYGKYRGFNFDQAALTATTMFGADKTAKWQHIANEAVDRNYFQSAIYNIQEFKDVAEHRYEAVKAVAAAIKEEAEYDDAQQQLEEADAQLEADLMEFATLLEQAKTGMGRCEEIRDRDNQDDDALDDLISGLQKLSTE